MQRYQDLINDATKALYEKSDTPRIDAELLIQHVLGQPLAWLIAHSENAASPEHIKHFFDLLKQRFEGKPIAYILGYREFWTLHLKVDENVLIPRPDTETLVEKALEQIPINETHNILDLGTGSGAIALSIAKERPKCTVLATDKSEKALNIARENARLNKIANVRFVHSDWFLALDNKKKFDLIATNPPYVQANDSHLDKLRFEPNIALVSDEKGLGDIRRIVENAHNYLLKGGHIILEHGFDQQQLDTQIISDNGYQDVRGYKDINQLPRCSAAKWPH